MMPIGSGLISIENVLYEQHGGPWPLQIVHLPR